MLKKSTIKYIFLVAVLFAIASTEVECRRKVLQGRRTVNRTYLRPMAIPAWAIILLIALGEIILGAIFYVVLKKRIIDTPLQSAYNPAPLSET